MGQHSLEKTGTGTDVAAKYGSQCKSAVEYGDGLICQEARSMPTWPSEPDQLADKQNPASAGKQHCVDNWFVSNACSHTTDRTCIHKSYELIKGFTLIWISFQQEPFMSRNIKEFIILWAQIYFKGFQNIKLRCRII